MYLAICNVQDLVYNLKLFPNVLCDRTLLTNWLVRNQEKKSKTYPVFFQIELCCLQFLSKEEDWTSVI